MTAPVSHGSGQGPLSTIQNTASVVEFSCLFTHDIRRKQKRWHDGTLRYHSFNKRIMVYDTQGGFIGDKHWKQVEAPQEGEELTLDKGALIEVGVQVMTTETDISELFKRKGKQTTDDGGSHESPKRRYPLPATVNALQPKHKSLKALLGPRQGPYGKASLPVKSPYEMRRDDQENRRPTDDYRAKRTRIDDGRDKRKPVFELPHQIVIGSSDPISQAGMKTVATESLVHHSSDEIRSDVTVPPTPPSGHVHRNMSAAQATQPFDRSTIADSRTGMKEAGSPEPLVAQSAPRPGTVVGSSHAIRRPTLDKPTQTRPLRIVKAPPRRMLMCLGEQQTHKTRDDTPSTAASRDESDVQARASSAKQYQHKLKKRSLLDIEDELDALEHGAGSASVVRDAMPKRTPFQRTMSLDAFKPATESIEVEPRSKGQRRSPLKKAKSMSTTDAGDGAMAKKSRSSKSTMNGGGEPLLQTKPPLKSIQIEPWSIEASDLFEWRRPGIATAKADTAVNAA